MLELPKDGQTFVPRTKNFRRSMNVHSTQAGGVASLRRDSDDENAEILSAALNMVVDKLSNYSENIEQRQASEAPLLKPHMKQVQLGKTVHLEAAMLERCAHPNVIGFYGVCDSGKTLVIEAGEHDLYDHISTAPGHRLQDEEILQITRCIASALCTIHARGCAHNDIKAENIVMCRYAGEDKLVPKIIDFEFATATGQTTMPAGGTLAYYAPEKQAQRIYANKPTDMWALGVTLHLAAFSCFPNGTFEPLPILARDFKCPAGLDPRLTTLLENLLVVDPALRWTARDVLHHLGLPFSKSPPDLHALQLTLVDTTPVAHSEDTKIDSPYCRPLMSPVVLKPREDREYDVQLLKSPIPSRGTNFFVPPHITTSKASRALCAHLLSPPRPLVSPVKITAVSPTPKNRPPSTTNKSKRIPVALVPSSIAVTKAEKAVS